MPPAPRRRRWVREAQIDGHHGQLQRVHKPKRAQPSAASTGRARWTRGGNTRIARCGFEALRRAALFFFVKNRASVSNKPSAPSVRPTRRVAAIARTRAETSGQPAHALRYPRAFEQSFGHGHMWASHRPSATLASGTKEVAATTRAIHRYTGRDGLVAVTRNSAKTPRRRTGTSARAATTWIRSR